MIAISADSPCARRQLLPSSVDFAAREAVISRLEQDYEASLDQLDALNARLEACLAVLTGKPAASGAAVNVPMPQQSLRDAA